MRVDFTDTLDVRRDLDLVEACPQESVAPLLRGQKTWIRANFRVGFDVVKTVQNLKHQFRIHRLIVVRPHAFAYHEPAITSKGRARLVQAKQEVFRDVHDIDSIDELEFS